MAKGNKTYSEKLRDPRWQKKRLEILQRDKWRCFDCNSEIKTLNVHHYKYEANKDPWDYDNSILVTLCVECHRHEEAIKQMHPHLKIISESTLILCSKLIHWSLFIGFVFSKDKNFYNTMRNSANEFNGSCPGEFEEFINEFQKQVHG